MAHCSAPCPRLSPVVARVGGGVLVAEWGRGAANQMFKPNQGSIVRRIDRATTLIGRVLVSVLLLLVLWWLVSQGIRAI